MFIYNFYKVITDAIRRINNIGVTKRKEKKPLDSKEDDGAQPH